MKKFTLTMLLLLSFGFAAMAQEGGLFGKGPDRGQNDGFMNRDGGLMLPAQHGEGNNDPAAPLGTGTAMLLGLGAAYAAAKSRKNKKNDHKGRGLMVAAMILFMAPAMTVMGQTTHTIGWGAASGDDGTYTNFTATSGTVSNVLSFSTEKNSSQNAPAYNANASELRLYYASSGDGGSITITPASGVTITDAVMTTSTTPSVNYYVNGGAAVSVTASNSTYTISNITASTSLKIQNANTSNTQLRISTIALTYTTGGSVPTTYTVTYHANVTGIDDIVETYNEGATVTIADNTFSNPGYAFTEWNTEANGNGDSYEPGNEIEGIDANIDLYAQWEQSSELTLTFPLNSNPGDWPTVNTELTEYTYTLDGVDYTFALMNAKCNSGYLMVTSVGVVGLPAIEGYKLTKVVASNSGGCSTSTKVGISSSASSASYIAGGAAQTWSTTSSQYTYNLTSTDANTMYYLYVTNKNAQVTSVALTYEAIDANVPSITASNVDITYDATSGSIAYTIENEPTPVGTLTANTTANWLTLGTVTSEAVPFTCTENDAVVSRTATVTLTYTYGNNATTKDIVVTQGVDETLGTANNPYTVAQARAFIDGLDGATSSEKYVSGIISQIDSYNSNYNSITYWISDDGTPTNQLEVYSGKGINGTGFSSINDVELTAEVVVKGNLKLYNGTYEFDKNNELVVYNAPEHEVEAPTFNPVAGTYAETQTVTISTETTGAAIYYTIDGTEPTNESTEFTTALTISTTTTVKAIAYVGSDASNVATANYYFCSTEDPYTVTEALAFATYQYPANGIYVHGIVSTAPESLSNGTLTYYISADGVATNQLEVYKGKNLNNESFTAVDDIQVGDIVTIYGNVQVYNNTIEFGSGNYLVAFERPQQVLEEYDLTVSTLNAHINAIYVFNAEDENTPLIEEGQDGTVQVLEGTDIIVSPEVEQGYVLTSLTVLDSEGESVQPENHMSDGGYYSFTMPSGPVTITATAALADDYELFSGDLVEGDYIIYYNGYALKNEELGTSGRLAYETVSPDDDVIATADATIVWHIAQSGDYWTIYSADAQAYAASTGAKNKAQMLSDGNDDKALWTVTTEEGTYEFANKANQAANVNYLLRNNGTNGFACYAEATGGALSLYKKVERPTFITDGEWNVAANWSTGEVPASTDDVVINAAATIPANYTASVNNIYLGENGSITLADGGQLIHNNTGVQITAQKVIEPYDPESTGLGKTDGWYFISSPVTESLEPTTTMLSNTYDLYRLNDVTWENYKLETNNFTTLENGTGYLYANSNEVTLEFTGTANIFTTEDGANVKVLDEGWQFVGNPYPFKIFINATGYQLNPDRNTITCEDSKITAIMPCEAVIVEGGQTITFTTVAPERPRGGLQVTLADNSKGSRTLDNAIVSFDEESQLGKFYFGQNDANIYLPRDNKEFAIVGSSRQGEMPVNFVANRNGQYTLNVNPEEVEMNYLHLIDNLTGADVDLLANPSYTFDAKASDIAARFRLVFNANSNNETIEGEPFAFVSNGQIVFTTDVNNANLQIVDMLGRVVFNGNANHNVSTANMTSGVYVLQLNGRTQKIVLNK